MKEKGNKNKNKNKNKEIILLNRKVGGKMQIPGFMSVESEGCQGRCFSRFGGYFQKYMQLTFTSYYTN